MRSSTKIKTLLGAMGVIALMNATDVTTKAANWYYGTAGNCSISALGGWQKCNNIKDTKGTTNTTFHVKTLTRTMTSQPKIRLVNSDNAQRSSEINLPKNNQEATGSLYASAQKGYYYYASISPAWNQVGTDSVTAQISAD